MHSLSSKFCEIRIAMGDLICKYVFMNTCTFKLVERLNNKVMGIHDNKKLWFVEWGTYLLRFIILYA